MTLFPEMAICPGVSFSSKRSGYKSNIARHHAAYSARLLNRMRSADRYPDRNESVPRTWCEIPSRVLSTSGRYATRNVFDAQSVTCCDSAGSCPPRYERRTRFICSENQLALLVAGRQPFAGCQRFVGRGPEGVDLGGIEARRRSSPATLSVTSKARPCSATWSSSSADELVFALLRMSSSVSRVSSPPGSRRLGIAARVWLVSVEAGRCLLHDPALPILPRKRCRRAIEWQHCVA